MALTVHIWSDIACPWCYIGKKRLETAIEKFGEPVLLEWHSFQLDPRTAPSELSYAERLSKKLGIPLERVRALWSDMAERGRRDGIDFHFERAVSANTLDAHRLLHWAAEQGLQTELKDRLFRAHFSEGVNVSDKTELARLASEVGLDVDQAASLLASDRFTTEVRADQEQAQSLGVTGVPFFVIGRYGVAGAQSAEALLQVLDRAHVEESEQPKSTDLSEGSVCGPDGC